MMNTIAIFYFTLPECLSPRYTLHSQGRVGDLPSTTLFVSYFPLHLSLTTLLGLVRRLILRYLFQPHPQAAANFLPLARACPPRNIFENVL